VVNKKENNERQCRNGEESSRHRQPHRFTQAHRDSGLAGASAPGPGSPKGAQRAPSKNKLVTGMKKGENEQAEMGRLKTVHQTQHASSCPVGSKTCHVLLYDCQKSQTGPKSIESKETRLF